MQASLVDFLVPAGKYALQQRVAHNHDIRPVLYQAAHRVDRRCRSPRRIAKRPRERIGHIAIELVAERNMQAIGHAVTIAVIHVTLACKRHGRFHQVYASPH